MSSWRPEWADLDAATFARIQNLNRFCSIVLGWIQTPVNRHPATVDRLGDAMYDVADEDRRVCEAAYEAAATGTDYAVEAAYLAIKQRIYEISRGVDEIDEPEIAAVDEPASMTTDDRLAMLYKNTPEARNWTAKKVAEILGVDKSTVIKTPMWKANQNQITGARNDMRGRDVTGESRGEFTDN